MEYGPPWLLTDRIAEDPIVAIAAPRPDFQGALHEFMVGLLGVALQVDEREWEGLWREPPTTDELRARLDALPAAFDLDGDGGRFFQAFPAEDLTAAPPLPIEELLVDSKTSTLFVKQGRVERMCRPAAAMAVLTMQSYAPEGGRGHLTSVRGGGPLTTLIDPRVDERGEPRAHELPLWRKLWANVETAQQVAERSPSSKFNAPSHVFPWLAPVPSGAAAKLAIVEANTNPWQAYFGLPRRIRLDFDGPGRCDLTGREDEVTVTMFRLRPNGVRYGTWRHPLSPHYQSAGKEMLPVHGQPGGVAWRDWLGMTFGTADGKRVPAAVVSSFGERGRSIGIREARIHAFGYDTNKAKIRGWTDATQPVFVSPGGGETDMTLVRDTAVRLVESASIAASMLEGAVKRALFQSSDDVSGDISAVRAELWATTEAGFFSIMRDVSGADDASATADEMCRRFIGTLMATAFSIFDRWCPGDESTPQAMRRVVAARYELSRALGGWTPLGEKLYEALRIPLPGGGRAVRKATSRARKEAKK